jgi:hypothetical protein
MPRRGLSSKARARHSIPKTVLISSLFRTVDMNHTGTWRLAELEVFAQSTGYQMDRNQLHEDIWELLVEAGFNPPSFDSLGISRAQLAQMLHRKGVLPMNKAALRRTIRYINMPEIQGPLPRYGHGSWRSLKYIKIRDAAKHWKQGVAWHLVDIPWYLKPNACSDPKCPLKTHPELFR